MAENALIPNEVGATGRGLSAPLGNFANGGTNAYIVRVPGHDSKPAKVTLLDGFGGGAKKALTLTALSNGTWSDQLIADLDYDKAADGKSFLTSLERSHGDIWILEGFAKP